MYTVDNDVQLEFQLPAITYDEVHTLLDVPHELRNIAQILNLYLQLMRREQDVELCDKKQAQFDILLTQSERLVELADKLK